MDNVEYSGHWWRPGKSAEKVGGKLKYDPDGGIELDLYEAFEGSPAFQDQFSHLPRIYGLSKDGDQLVIKDCHKTSSGSTISGGMPASTATYRAGHIVEGDHIPTNKNISFDDLYFSFPALEQWSGVISPGSSSGTYTPGGSFNIQVDLPDEQVVHLPDFDVKLYTYGGVKNQRGAAPKPNVETAFRIIPKHPSITVSRVREIVSWFRDLLSFALDEPVVPRYVRGSLSTSGTSVNLYFPTATNSGAQPGTIVHSSNFTIADIPGGFPHLIKRWYSLQENIKTSLDLYLGTHYSPNMYQQNVFFTLVQAVEAYHRRRFQDRYVSRWKYEENMLGDLKEFINGDMASVYDNSGMFHSGGPSSIPVNNLKTLDDAYGVPNRFYSVLKSTLKYANEYSLRNRFKQLVNDEYAHILSNLPNSASGKIHPIVETRNSLAHQLEESDKSAAVAQGSEMTRLAWSVQQLLEVMFMDDLGVPDRHIIDTLSERYSQYRVV